MTPYCSVRIKQIHRGAGEADGERTETPENFDELIVLLTHVRDRFADDYADKLVADEGFARDVRGQVLGGFGVEVINRWGGTVEVAAGRDAWFLFRHQPLPSRCLSDRPLIAGTRVFYLDGGHHTELGPDMLVSQGECLRVLRFWLDADDFPDQS